MPSAVDRNLPLNVTHRFRGSRTLEETAKKAGTGIGNNLQVNYDTLQQAHAQLRSEYETLTERLEGVQGELSGAKGNATQAVDAQRIAEAKLSGLQGEYQKLQDLYKASQRTSLVDDIEAGSLLEILAMNADTFTGTQRKVVEQYLRRTADTIESRTQYIDDRFEEAKRVLEQRDVYLKQFGQAAFDVLPEPAKKASLEVWQTAEALVREYNEKTPPLDILVLTSGSKFWATVIFPFYEQGNGDVTKMLIRTAKTYVKALESLGYTVTKETGPFTKFRINGNLDYALMKQKLLDAFGEVTEKAKIKFDIFYATEYLQYALGERKFKRTPQLKSLTLVDYVKSHAKKSRVKSFIKFCDSKGIDREVLWRISRGEQVPSETEIQQLARKLKIDSEEIKKRLPNAS